MQYRKRPVLINAWPVSDIYDQLTTETPGIPESVQKAYDNEDILILPDGRIAVTTLEGTHITGGTDMLIEGVNGEFYGCKLDIFKLTYEPVEDDEG